MIMIELSATEAARKIRDGEITSEELVQACLARIEKFEPAICAWVHLDAEIARDQARARDEARAAGADIGPLHGVPVGVKDIFDTCDWPTENGTVLDAGRRPTEDCAAVTLLKEAGAVIMGKTATTELAAFEPTVTTNPHDPSRTPGGSSSGSVAAIASGMVPLALGSQTNGSIIRPASFCGIVGFKPTRGRISRHGVLSTSPVMDHVGVFARSVPDVALIAETLMAYDVRDAGMRPCGRPRLVETVAGGPPVTPALGFVKSPVWDRAEETTKAAFAELAEALGDDCEEVDLPGPFDAAVDLYETIIEADMSKCLAPYYARGKDALSDGMRDRLEAGQEVRAVDYLRAIDGIEILNAGLDRMFDDYDAIITPAAIGEAPVGLGATGDPIFCTVWTFCGAPAITLPLMEGPNGMPLGVQLVGPRGDDARLLRTAEWLVQRVAAEDAA